MSLRRILCGLPVLLPSTDQGLTCAQALGALMAMLRVCVCWARTMLPQRPSRQKKEDMGAAGWTERQRAGRKRENLESNGQRVARLFLTRSLWKRDVSLCQFAPLTSPKQEKGITPSSSSSSSLALPSSHPFTHRPCFLVSDLSVVAFLPQLRGAETSHGPGGSCVWGGSQTKRPSSQPVVSKRRPASAASTHH